MEMVEVFTKLICGVFFLFYCIFFSLNKKKREEAIFGDIYLFIYFFYNEIKNSVVNKKIWWGDFFLYE